MSVGAGIAYWQALRVVRWPHCSSGMPSAAPSPRSRVTWRRTPRWRQHAAVVAGRHAPPRRSVRRRLRACRGRGGSPGAAAGSAARGGCGATAKYHCHSGAASRRPAGGHPGDAVTRHERPGLPLTGARPRRCDHCPVDGATLQPHRRGTRVGLACLISRGKCVSRARYWDSI